MMRIGVIGIVVEGDRSIAQQVQSIISDFGDIIVGRMGVPEKQYNISVISLIVNGTTEQISSLTGKLGKLENVSVKSALTSTIINKEQ